MITYESHREIIKLWDDVRPRKSNGNKNFSCFTVLARDITRYMPDAPICTYHKVLRWYERNSIPIEYHDALVEAARMRDIPGVTHQALAAIKARDFISRHEAECAREISMA
jgi:hypothetical protein